MNTKLQILVVEDTESDALLLIREIKKAGYEIEWERVETGPDMQDALDHKTWDLVISDYSMPQFNAPAALSMLQKSGLDIPFIIVSGTIGEDNAVSALKAGAHDFLIKGSFARLVPAIEREIRDAGIRREKKQAEHTLRESESRFRTLFENMPIGLYRTSADARLLDVNPAMMEMFGYKDRHALLEKSITDLYVDPSIFERIKNEIETSQISVFESEFRRKDSKTIWAENRIHSVLSENGTPLFYEGSLIDITKRRQADEKIRRQINYLTALQDIDRTIAATFEMGASLQTLLSRAISLLGVDAASILLVNFSLNKLEYVAELGFESEIEEFAQIPFSESYAGKVVVERRFVKISDLEAEQDNLLNRTFLRNEKFVSYYGVPLTLKGKIIGVLEVFHRSLTRHDQEWLDFLNALAGQAAIAISNAQLFDNLQRSNSELMRAYDATIEGWSSALDLRDKETEGHSQRVTEMTIKLADKFDIVDEELIHIRRGALLHDIGKLGIPDSILLKPDKLTDEEWTIMRMHPTYAYEMLSSITYLHDALDIPYCHHEKWNGTGYPRGLKGEQIPLAARIFAIVDVWDALSSDRPYRAGWAQEKVLDYIHDEAGKHFDPQAVSAFLTLADNGHS